MLKGKKAKGKKVVPAPAVVKKQEAKKVVYPIWEKAQEFWLWTGHPALKGLTHFVNGPSNIRLQQQRTILY